MSHTPGPWTLVAGRTIDTSSGKFFLSYGSVIGTGEPLFRNFTELDRNAVLIAAAPELLAAAEKVVACGALPRERHPCEAIKELVGAIKKAKGE